MPKFSIKAQCLNQNNTPNGSNATFVVKEKEQPDPQPGQPRQIAAKTVIQLNCKDATAKQFETGKEYTVTISD